METFFFSSIRRVLYGSQFNALGFLERKKGVPLYTPLYTGAVLNKFQTTSISQTGGRAPETAASLLAAGLDARAAELVSVLLFLFPPLFIAIGPLFYCSFYRPSEKIFHVLVPSIR